MSNQYFIFPPGSSVVLKQATIFTKEAYVQWGMNIHRLGDIWDKVMTTYQKNTIPKERFNQFYIKALEIVISSKVIYGRGRGRKEGVVLGMGEGKKGRWVTVEFPGNNRATKPYNSFSLVGYETLIPIEQTYDMYSKLWNEYKDRNKSIMGLGMLMHLIAPFYKVKYIDKVLFACDPVFAQPNPNFVEPEDSGTREVNAGISPHVEKEIVLQEAPSKASDYDVEVFTNQYEIAKEALKSKITLTVSLEGLEKQLLEQGYKIVKI